MNLTEEILSELQAQPLDLDALSAQLNSPETPTLRSALSDLIDAGLVVEAHLQTLPPRTLYRLSADAEPCLRD